MTAETLPLRPATGTPTRASRPGGALTRLAARQIRRGALIVLAVAAGMSALVATTYDSVIADPAAAGALDALAANPAIRTLFGEPVALDDPGGFTVWRTGTVIAVIIGVTWLGVTSTGGDLRVAAALAGTWNILPIAALCLGAALFALGWAPRTTGALGALPAAGGFLLQTIAESIGAPAWVIGLSPFAHLAPVPLAEVNWPATLAMSAIAVALTVVGGYGYQRRDLRG